MSVRGPGPWHTHKAPPLMPLGQSEVCSQDMYNTNWQSIIEPLPLSVNSLLVRILLCPGKQCPLLLTLIKAVNFFFMLCKTSWDRAYWMHEKLTVLFYLYLNNLEDHSTITIINYIRISHVAGFLSVSLFSWNKDTIISLFQNKHKMCCLNLCTVLSNPDKESTTHKPKNTQGFIIRKVS